MIRYMNDKKDEIKERIKKCLTKLNSTNINLVRFNIVILIKLMTND